MSRRKDFLKLDEFSSIRSRTTDLGFAMRSQSTLNPSNSSTKHKLIWSRWTISIILTMVLQAGAVLGMEIYVFARYQNNLLHPLHKKDTKLSKTIPTFLSLFIFGLVYELILVFDSLRLKSAIQIAGTCLCNLGLVVYGAFQVNQIQNAVFTLVPSRTIDTSTWDEIQGVLFAIPVVNAAGTLVMAGISYKLVKEFRKSIYNTITKSDWMFQKLYRIYQIFIAMLKFDFFFFLGFTVQFLVIVQEDKNAEFGVTVAAIPVTILILIASAWAVRAENLYIMASCIIVYFGGLAYFIFKMVRMYYGSKAQLYTTVRSSLTFFAVLTIILIVGTIIMAIMCTANFNKGLKDKLRKTDEQANTDLATIEPMHVTNVVLD